MDMKKYKTIPSDYVPLGERVRVAIMEAWGLGERGLWWVSELALDALYIDYVGSLSLAEAVYCLRVCVTYEEFREWTAYNVRICDIKGKHPEASVFHIDLRSWHEGAPRLTEDELKKLEE